MNRSTPRAFGLLVLLLSGCPKEQGDTYPVRGLNGDAMAKSLEPGASIQDCLDLVISGDTATFDTAAITASAWCPDEDDDGYVAADAADPFQTGCLCIVAGELDESWLEMTSDADLKEDCDDENSEVTGASVSAYVDMDSDGYGIGDATLICGIDWGYSTVAGDCDDDTWAINPDAVEVCDDVDNNCDGDIDDADDDLADSLGIWYEDNDADSFGDPLDSFTGCDQPEGFVEDDTDCDDGDVSVNPDALEVCNGFDDDCDEQYDDEDEDLASWTGTEFAIDGDGDGYGMIGGETLWMCNMPEGYAESEDDCDDEDDGINPGATEIADDGIDQDCDGSDETTSSADDADGDGFDSIEAGGTDCDDTDAAVNPDAVEISLNLVDDNCDGVANVSDTIEICATPESALSAFAWELWIRDGTVYPDGNDDPDWASPGYADGTGELCADFLVIDGNTLVLNGPFDIDGDGTAGEAYIDGDGVWLAMSDGTHYQGDITGDGVALNLTSTSWGAGSDLIEVDIDLL